MFAFNPAAAGSRNATLAILSDASNGTATLTLDTAGAGGAPALQLRFLEETQARALMAQLEREMVRRKLRW